jgi:hypothetical protein
MDNVDENKCQPFIFGLLKIYRFRQNFEFSEGLLAM